jgi:hypothetical protein
VRAVLENLVALGLPDEPSRRSPGRIRIQPLGEICQGVVAAGLLDARGGPRRRVHQPFGLVKADPLRDATQQLGPGQIAACHLRLLAHVTRVLQAALQARMVQGMVADGLGGGAASSRYALAAGLLIAPKHQQLGVGGEDLPEGVLELSAGLDAPSHLLHPLGRNALDALFAVGDEGEKPDGVASPFSTVAGGLAAAAIGERERAGQQVLRQLGTADEFALAPAQASLCEGENTTPSNAPADRQPSR